VRDSDIIIPDGTVLAALEPVVTVSIVMETNEEVINANLTELLDDLVDRVDEAVPLEI
jgi:hypothetical protein